MHEKCTSHKCERHSIATHHRAGCRCKLWALPVLQHAERRMVTAGCKAMIEPNWMRFFRKYIRALTKHGFTILLYQMSLNNSSVPHLAEQEHTRFAEIHESTNGLLPYPKHQNQLRQLCLSPSGGVAPESGDKNQDDKHLQSYQKQTTFKGLNKQVCKSSDYIDDSKTLGDLWRSWRSSLLSKYWWKKHFKVKTTIHIEIKRVSLESPWICFQSLSLLKDMQFSSLNPSCSYIEPFFKWFSKAFCASPAMRPTFPASVNPRRAKRWKQRAARSKRNSQAIQLEVGSRSASISPVRGSQAVLFSLIFLWMDESSLPQCRGDVFICFPCCFSELCYQKLRQTCCGTWQKCLTFWRWYCLLQAFAIWTAVPTTQEMPATSTQPVMIAIHLSRCISPDGVGSRIFSVRWWRVSEDQTCQGKFGQVTISKLGNQSDQSHLQPKTNRRTAFVLRLLVSPGHPSFFFSVVAQGLSESVASNEKTWRKPENETKFEIQQSQ